MEPGQQAASTENRLGLPSSLAEEEEMQPIASEGFLDGTPENFEAAFLQRSGKKQAASPAATQPNNT